MKSFVAFAVLFALPSAFAVTVSYEPQYDNASGDLASTACSDGQNGLITRFGWQHFGDVPSFPYIGGAETIAGWNSPSCGTCWQLTYADTGKSINVLAVDHTDSGFNIAQEALDDLTNGQAGQLGRIDATATQIDISLCGVSAWSVVPSIRCSGILPFLS